MSLFYQEKINTTTKLAIWKIEEDENFFTEKIPLQKDISHPHKRLQHLAGRYLLPLLFADFPMEEIVIADSRKPFLKNEKYHFSISHCGDYAAAIASSESRVGIDIEPYSEKVERVKNKFLNEAEKQFVQKHNNNLQLTTTLWCAKEAAYKWYSYGLLNFRENILLHPVSFFSEGIMNAVLIKNEEKFLFDVHYKIFPNISLAWISA